jgi:hypothetical protein
MEPKAKVKKARAVRCHVIYGITYHEEDTPSGVVQEWFTTFAKAQRKLKKLGLQDSEEVRAVEVPRPKVAFVGWLNVNAKVG